MTVPPLCLTFTASEDGGRGLFDICIFRLFLALARADAAYRLPAARVIFLSIRASSSVAPSPVACICDLPARRFFIRLFALTLQVPGGNPTPAARLQCRSLHFCTNSFSLFIHLAPLFLASLVAFFFRDISCRLRTPPSASQGGRTGMWRAPRRSPRLLPLETSARDRGVVGD